MNNSHKTAIARRTISSPAKHIENSSLLVGRVLDYGCGKGKDCETLKICGIDPHYTLGKLVDGEERRELSSTDKFDTIMCNFVLNVIEDQSERSAVLAKIQDLLSHGGKAYISVRNDRAKLNGLTKLGTWQGYIALDLPIVKTTASFVMYLLEKE